MQKRFIPIISLVLVFFMTATAFASKLNDAKKDFNSVSGNIKDVKNEIAEIQKEKKDVSDQINQIDQDLTKKEQELAVVEKQLSKTQAELEKVTGELNATEQELIRTQTNLERLKEELEKAIQEAQHQEEQNAMRLRAMYMNTNTSYLELILEAKSLNDLLDRLDMIRQMITYDQQVFDHMLLYRDEVDQRKQGCESEEQKILTYKAEIEGQKAVLEQKHKEIRTSRQLISRQKKNIQATQDEKKALMGQLSAEEAKARKELDQLEKDSKALEKKIKELQEAQKKQNSNPPDFNGNRWPVPGYTHISSSFGMRKHPIYKINKMHTGIDIAGSGIGGKPAVAMADGVVILSQYYGGYGNCVIIDHGGGISTLYAHGRSTTVSVGQSVKKGDTVLKIGTTGTSTGNHLHFEVRKNGSPVNPLNYVKR